MTNRRIKLLNKLIGKTTGEDEAKLYKLTIERICIDMCDYYYKFYHNDGPGAMVYVPTHEDEKKSMFYLTVNNLKSVIATIKSTTNNIEDEIKGFNSPHALQEISIKDFQLFEN